VVGSAEPEAALMQVDPVLTGVEAAVSTQLAVAGADPAVEVAAGQLLAALGPALRQAAMELAQQAAAEVGAQLGDRDVEVVLVDGDPTLRVVDRNGVAVSDEGEDFDARITLRLPPSLKGLVEDAAGLSGDSVNTWVVKTLTSKAGRASARTGKRVTGRFEL
jgi:hypothetical protein